MELKDKIADVIGGVDVVDVATVESSSETAPRVKYMSTVGFPDLSMQSATMKLPKVQQIKVPEPVLPSGKVSNLRKLLHSLMS